jgi:ATP-dependent Clp protease adaptor protein ClpS
MSTQTDQTISILEKDEIKERSKYKVIIHDNPVTSFDEVIFIISRVFNKTQAESEALAKEVHEKHKGVCGVYSLEIANTKIKATDMAKAYLCDVMPFRRNAILELKFTVEQE